jgi:hypothetical protein
VKKYVSLLLVLLLLPTLVACSGILEGAQEETPTLPAIPPTPTSSPTATSTASESGLVYVKEGMVYLIHNDGEQPIGPLPEDAGHLALGQRGLAYVSGNRIQLLTLADGTTATLRDLGELPGQDFDLHWSSDGSTLAYAAAWDESDGSRMVELGTTDLYELTVVDTLAARPAGPTPTPPPEPPIPPEPGFLNLHILGFDQFAGRLAVTQAGGEERYSAMWLYDSLAGKRVETTPLAVEVQTLALSPDLVRLAVAAPGVLRVYEAGQIGGDGRCVQLPAETHATWLYWSPDSQRLAYLLNEGAAPGLDASLSLALEICEARTGQVHRVISDINSYAAMHGWTADGKSVILEALDEASGQVTVNQVDADTGQSKPISLPEGTRVLGWVRNS